MADRRRGRSDRGRWRRPRRGTPQSHRQPHTRQHRELTAPTLLQHTEPPQPQLDTLFATANSVLLDVGASVFENRPSTIERVSDTPSRLELLQFTRRVVEQQARASLRQLDRWIADEERRETERRQAEERRPPPPEWLIERGLDRSSLLAVHTGDCWDPGKRQMPTTREQARDAIRQQVPACSKCRPDTRLGLLE